jgi:hypothetical protein
MGRIITGCDPNIVLPTRDIADYVGFSRTLSTFLERQRRGLRLYPVLVRFMEGQGYAELDGMKRLSIACLTDNKVDLYVVGSAQDLVPRGGFGGLHPGVLDRMNHAISGRFNILDDYLEMTRRRGVYNVRDFIRKNREVIDRAWEEITEKGIERHPKTCPL